MGNWMIDPVTMNVAIPHWVVAVGSLLPSLLLGFLCYKVLDFIGFCVGVILGLMVSFMLGAWVLPYFVYFTIGGLSFVGVVICAVLIRSDKQRSSPE